MLSVPRRSGDAESARGAAHAGQAAEAVAEEREVVAGRRLGDEEEEDGEAAEDCG